VHAAACQQFSTVLAPGSNAFHYDHIHVDLARHASGRSICNPKAVPGDAVARRSDPAFTGSVSAGARRPLAAGFAGED
jgi:Extensin-like protein C-terminus